MSKIVIRVPDVNYTVDDVVTDIEDLSARATDCCSDLRYSVHRELHHSIRRLQLRGHHRHWC